jgi:DNA-binding MarR family transcriptional regulator
MHSAATTTVTKKGRGSRPAALRYDSIAVLLYIADCLGGASPHSPSLRQIKDRFNMGSTSTAKAYTDGLEAEKLIGRTAGVGRSFFLTQDGRERVAQLRTPHERVVE